MPISFTPTLEQIRTQVSEAKTKIEDSKTLSVEERLAKAEELDATVSQIKKDLDSLKQGATPDKLQEIELLELEYEALQNQLNVFKDELQSFQDNIVSNMENEIKEESKQEEKNNNKRSRFGRQIEGLTSKEEWQTNPGKNVARIAGGFSAIWLGAKIINGIKNGVKKLFNKKNKDNSENKQKESSKKPRYKKRRGIMGIGLAGIGSFLGIRWFMTGRNPLDWGGPGLSEPPEKQLTSYIDLAKNSPEKFQKYQDVGTNVNDIYSKVYEKEINSGWKDVDALGKIGLEHSQEVKNSNPDVIYSGLVPYVMDRNFSSVGKMISSEGLMYQERSSDLEYLKNKVLSRGKEKISGLLGPILGSFQSWTSLGSKSGESIEDKFSRWAESGNPEERLHELQFFFRQYMKVNTYLICKKDEIIISIAKEKFDTNSGEFSTYEDAMEDSEWFKNNIEKDKRYKDFMSGKLADVSKNIESAGVSVTSLSQEIEEQISDLDEQRDEMLHFDGNKDILDTAEQEIKSGELSETTKNKLSQSCDSMLEDIEEEVEEAVKESCWSPYSELFNTTGSNKEEFIKETGLEDLFSNLKETIKEYQEKVKNGSITKDNYENFKDVINNYFALKKEMVIGTQTLQEINDGKALVVKATGFLWGCIGNLLKACDKFSQKKWGEFAIYGLTGAAPFVLLRGVFNPGKSYKVIKYVAPKVGAVPRKVVQSNMRVAKKVAGKYVGSPKVLRRTIFSGESGPAKLERVLKNGEISLDKAADIIRYGRRGILKKGVVKDARSVFDGASPYLIQEQLIQKLIPGLHKTDVGLAIKYYNNKTLGTILRGPDGIKNIEVIDMYLKGMSVDKQKYILEICQNKKLTFEAVDDLISKIDDVYITEISTDKIAKQLSKGTGIDEILSKVSSKIDDTTMKKVTDLIDKEIKEMSTLYDSKIAKGKIEKLKVLKKSGKLTQENAEILLKLDAKGIKVRHFPDISDLLKNDQKIAKALSKGDFKKFVKLSKAKNLPHISKVVDDLTFVLKKGGNYVDDIVEITKDIGKIIKGLSKII